MKVSDYILDFLSAKGVKHVFLITGGVLTPLVDAFAGRSDILYICVQHEQAAAMAADGYARFNGLGCAMATSGPGATNLITGIGCSYFDSIPVIYITGNVNTREAKGHMKVRQRGFQETDIVSIVKPITKLARMVTNPKVIDYEMENAYHVATTGRPGPVLLDIPIDVQQAEIDPDTLLSFTPERIPTFDLEYREVKDEIARAKRPVLIYGAGCRDARQELLKFIEKTGIPCLPSWAALDLVPHNHPNFVGQFGVYGSRAGNFTVQNADYILAIGTRLDTRMTGNPDTFAPRAERIRIVDIDIHEAGKLKGARVKIEPTPAKEFLKAVLQELPPKPKTRPLPAEMWWQRIQDWKRRYPISAAQGESRDPVHPLNLVKKISELAAPDAIIVSDAGGNLSFTHQGISLTEGQRLFSAYGYSPMGYALPAAIGAHYATGKPVICLIGDGGIQINFQEMQTLAHYQVPVKIFIFNNRSYGIIQQFQEELFNGRYEAADPDHGYSAPDFQKVIQAYGIRCTRVLNNSSLEFLTQAALAADTPQVVDVILDQSARIEPKTRYGNPLHKQSPELPEAETEANMELK